MSGGISFLIFPVLFGVFKASCTWMIHSISRLGKFSAIILLSILSMPLAYTSSMILGLVF
jgi:hypothetical protein